MRIVAGKWTGAALVSPAGRVRPTQETVRGLWLDELRDDVEGARVLELYAGSGALGLEALSRGAKYCDFVENSPSALHALKANVAALRARDRVKIFKRDALEFISRVELNRYDVILADPPYGSRQLDHLVSRWKQEPFSRILSVEHSVDHRIVEDEPTIIFGDTAITTFRVEV